MTERERLIALMGECCATYLNVTHLLDFEKAIIADYFLANGVIVPPCKVGDVVYDIHYGKVFGGKVIMLNMFDDCFTFVASGGRYYKDDDIGKTVFLTKEEAEQALRKEAEGK